MLTKHQIDFDISFYLPTTKSEEAFQYAVCEVLAKNSIHAENLRRNSTSRHKSLANKTSQFLKQKYWKPVKSLT